MLVSYLLVEGLVVLLVLGDFGKELQALLDDVLADDLQDLWLLESLTGDVQWEILGIDDTLDKVKILGNDLLAVVHDEHTTNVQFDRVLLLLVLEQIEWGAFGDEEKGAELQLTLDGEVLDGQVIFPVVGEGLVELGVLLIGDIIWVTGPDWFGLNSNVYFKSN